MSFNFKMHECRIQSNETPPDQAVEAYGLRRCPKLVQQITSENSELQQNSLILLNEVFLDPQSVSECIKEHIMTILSSILTDDSASCHNRLLASSALLKACKSIIGIGAIIDEQILKDLIFALNDDSNEIKKNIFECICYISETSTGVDSILKLDLVELLISKIQKESPHKSLILQTIYNIISKNQEGVERSVSSGVVKTVQSELCDSSNATAVQTLLMKVFGFACFNAVALQQAHENNALSCVVTVLLDSVDDNLISSCLLTLASLTSDDKGKLQIYETLGPGQTLNYITPYLYKENLAIRLNVLKVIANSAVLPASRDVLLSNERFMSLLRSISESDDIVLKKHAIITLKAVLWTP